jgi:hypothetical protein
VPVKCWRQEPATGKYRAKIGTTKRYNQEIVLEAGAVGQKCDYCLAEVKKKKGEAHVAPKRKSALNSCFLWVCPLADQNTVHLAE